jgi:iron(III) transport system substrate-binding protein
MALFQPEWDALIAAAQAEGELVPVTTGGAAREFEPLLQVFSDTFGISISQQRGRGRVVGDKITAERANGRYTIDAWHSGSGTMGRMANAGVFAPFVDALIHPKVADESLWRDGFQFVDEPQMFSFVYGTNKTLGSLQHNTDLLPVSRVEAGFTIWDLLVPEFMGLQAEAVLGDGSSGSSTLIRRFMAPRGKEWMERYWNEAKPVIVPDQRTCLDSLARGTFAIANCGAESGPAFNEMVDLGLPVAETEYEAFPGWRAGSGSTVGIVDRAPHPNAAKLWINWLLSPEGWEARLRTVEDNPELLRNSTFADTVSLHLEYTDEHVAPNLRIVEAEGFYLPQTDPSYQTNLLKARAWFTPVLVAAGYR